MTLRHEVESVLNPCPVCGYPKHGRDDFAFTIPLGYSSSGVKMEYVGSCDGYSFEGSIECSDA